MHTTDTNYIRVAIDQTGIATTDRLKPERAIYISFRVAQPLGGYDSGLPKELNARVWVHEYVSDGPLKVSMEMYSYGTCNVATTVTCRTA